MGIPAKPEMLLILIVIDDSQKKESLELSLHGSLISGKTRATDSLMIVLDCDERYRTN